MFESLRHVWAQTYNFGGRFDGRAALIRLGYPEASESSHLGSRDKLTCFPKAEPFKVGIFKLRAFSASAESLEGLIVAEFRFNGQLDLDSERLVFIDETETTAKMTRLLSGPTRRTLPRISAILSLEDHKLHLWHLTLGSHRSDDPRRLDEWGRS